MSESPESFPEVARLLRLKQHEVPPPGYFRGFSAKVIARIEAQQLAEARIEARPWWSALLTPLTWQRSLAGANTLLVVGIGITGVAAYQALQSSSDEENVTWAALQLPATSAVPLDRSLGVAANGSLRIEPRFRDMDAAAGPSVRTGIRDTVPANGLVPVSYSSGGEGIDRGAAFTPAALFAPPNSQTLQASQPRFVFPSE